MTNVFSKIGIIYNKRHNKAIEILERVISILTKNGVVYDSQGVDPTNDICFRGFDFTPDLNIIIGGDGTILYAARCFAEKCVPILGINSGNLGFLSQLSAESVDADLERLFNGDFRIEDRLMLKSVDNLKNPRIHFYALNDIIIKRGALSKPILFNVYVDDIKVNDFLGDGLIVSTPTGSTAYNLSAGGPIIVPEIKAVSVLPICSLSLAIRPIVIPDDKIVKILIANQPQHMFLNADGQEYIELKQGNIVYIMKSPYPARLVLLGKDEDSFFTVLRSKLHWGIFPGQYPVNDQFEPIKG